MTAATLDPVVHLVDDDAAIRDSLAFLFRSRGLKTRLWEDGAGLLSQDLSGACACIVLDVRMPDMDGMEVFDQLRARGVSAPVIFLTGHADVPIAVAALKKGAYDFLEKPFHDNTLVDLVEAALEESRRVFTQSREREALEDRLTSLSTREREVLDHLLAGRLNKQIADDLGVSIRTVEVHRSRVFEKMGVRNAVELANLVGTSLPRPV